MITNRFVGSFAFLATLAACAITACSSDDTTNPAGTPDASPPPPTGCPAGFQQCGAACFNLKKDEANCGKCGAQCADGQVCQQGACVTTCGGGTIKCGADCVDVKTDNNNCSACGGKCPTGELCSSGKCAPTCQTPFATCPGGGPDGHCADLQTSDVDCGTCGHACDAGYACSGGKCTSTCGAGLVKCAGGDAGDYCVDAMHDNANCGACGNKCKNGELCSPTDGGVACQIGCFGGTTQCGGNCVDTAIDPANCGGCGKVCNGTCYAGECCPGTQLSCGGVCVDHQTDNNNCGDCGISCNPGAQCTKGNCVCSSGPPQAACAHDLCDGSTGNQLKSGCSQCVTDVCAQDSYCCTVDWDNTCVSEVAQYCGQYSCC